MRETRNLFRQEQHIPTALIDRSTRSEGHPKSSVVRAAEEVGHLLAQYAAPALDRVMLEKFDSILQREREIRCAAASA